MPPIEALLKPVIDALLAALKGARSSSIKRNARRALEEAIKELVKIDPDIDGAEARIAIAKAAGIIERDLLTAEGMLDKVKSHSKKKAAAARAVSRRPPTGKSSRAQKPGKQQ